MNVAYLIRRRLSPTGWWPLCGSTAPGISPYQQVVLPSTATAAYYTSARFIVSDGARRGAGVMPETSSVKRMPPPPSSSLSSSTSVVQTPPEPMPATHRPLLDVEEMITVFADVFCAYGKQLQDFAGSKTTNNKNTSGGNGVNVPFYPPVPLEYIEEHFQPLLLRLLPACASIGDSSRDLKRVRISDGSTNAEKNRRQIASRIQSSGVFTLSSLQRGSFQRDGAASNGEGNFFLRLRPGVRELAVDIATFLFTLEPQHVTVRKAVPLSVIRRMSLSRTAVSFIRNELANDVRRLLLVYSQNVFVLTKNGTMVQLQEASMKCDDGFSTKPSVVETKSTSAITMATTEGGKAHENLASTTTASEDRKAEGNIIVGVTAEKKLSHLDAQFMFEEADTVVHMGKRFIAPAAMERYRLAQSLLPFLEFIPVANSTIPVNGGGDDDGFVDFVAIRDRAVLKYPYLATVLVLKHSDTSQLRESLLIAALSALGVEFRWGRTLPMKGQRPNHQQQKQKRHSNTDVSSAMEMGVLFLRRRVKPAATAVTSVPASPGVEKVGVRLLLLDLQVELYSVMMPRCIQERCKLSCFAHSVAMDNDEKVEAKEKQEDDMSDWIATNEKEGNVWDHVFFAVHSIVYEDLVTSAAPVMSTDSTPNIPFSTDVIYPAGTSANGAFVQHLLRYLTPRQHERLQSTLLGGVQGRVSPLFQHEIKDSIACFFFPYGRQSTSQETIGENEHQSPGGDSHRESDTGLVMFNKYVDGFFDNMSASSLPFIRPRTLPDEPPLAYRKKLPAKVVLEIVRCLYREQLRHAEEIGLEVDNSNDDDGDSDVVHQDSCLSFATLRHTLQPASRAYIRDNIGDLAVIPLLVSCFPRYFCVPVIDATASSWSVVGLRGEGRRLAKVLEASSKERHLLSHRSQRTGCFFTDDTSQQLDAFLICL